MELNLLLLPLLGGYYFYTHFNGTAYYAARCSSQRLLFGSAIAGLIFLLAGRLIWFVNEHLQLSGEPGARIVGAVMAGVALSGVVSLLVLGWKTFRPDPEKNAEPLKVVTGLLLGGIFLGLAIALWRQIPGSPWCSAWAILGIAALLFSCVQVASHYLEDVLIVPPENLALRILLASAFALLLVVLYVAYQPFLSPLWIEFSPYDYSATALFAFVLGVGIVAPMNALIFRHAAAIHRLYLKNKFTALESLFYESLKEQRQVQITLDDGKVYTGWIRGLLSQLSQVESHVRMVPLRSGYRETTSKEVRYTTSYDDVYALYLEKYQDWSETDFQQKIDEFSKLIPISRIVVAGMFDDEASDLFASSIGPPREGQSVANQG